MKKLSLILTSVLCSVMYLFLSCGKPNQNWSSDMCHGSYCYQGMNAYPSSISFELTAKQKEYLEKALLSVDFENIKYNLYTLASDEFEGRGTGYPGDLKASEFIVNYFKTWDIKGAYGTDNYLQKFSVNVGRKYSYNVVGYLEGQDVNYKNEVIVIGAHYDHLGKSGSKIYYGADDNASGTAGLMEIAKAFASIKEGLKRTLVFIAFSGEELGLIGSKYQVQNPFFKLDDTKYMINLDMIGYLRNKKLYFLGGGMYSFMENLIKEISANYADEITPYITSTPGSGSDHVSYSNKGIPTLFLHTGLHSYYHTTADTPDKINYEGLETTVKVAIEIIWRLNQVNNLTKPQSIIIDNHLDKYDHGVFQFPVSIIQN